MEQTNQVKGGVSNNKAMAIISYIGILWIIPLVTESKNDPFVKFHMKQGIVLTIAGILGWVVLAMIPILGWMLMPFFQMACLVFMILGIVNAATGKQVVLPIIGRLSDQLKI